LVKYFSNGITTSIIIFTQERRDVGNRKGDTNYVKPSKYNRYPDGANYSFWSILISILSFLCLEITVRKKRLFSFIPPTFHKAEEK
jgi:hypothetical protein